MASLPGMNKRKANSIPWYTKIWNMLRPNHEEDKEPAALVWDEARGLWIDRNNPHQYGAIHNGYELPSQIYLSKLIPQQSKKSAPNLPIRTDINSPGTVNNRQHSLSNDLLMHQNNLQLTEFDRPVVPSAINRIKEADLIDLKSDIPKATQPRNDFSQYESFSAIRPADSVNDSRSKNDYESFYRPVALISELSEPQKQGFNLNPTSERRQLVSYNNVMPTEPESPPFKYSGNEDTVFGVQTLQSDLDSNIIYSTFESAPTGDEDSTNLFAGND